MNGPGHFDSNLAKTNSLQAVGLRQVEVKLETCLVPGIFYSMTAVRSETNRKFQTSGMTLIQFASLAVLDIWSLVLGQVFLNAELGYQFLFNLIYGNVFLWLSALGE
jgi:hypothetical protein